MGRASRRKRANGGPGFFRREHLLAAATPRQDTPRTPHDVRQDDTSASQPEQPRDISQPPLHDQETETGGGDRQA